MSTTSSRTHLTDDPALPSRDSLLDPDHVAERLSRIFDREGSIEDCRLRRADYRFGASIRVVYDVSCDGRPFVITGRTFAASDREFRRAVTDALPVDGIAAIAHDEHTDTVWWTLPNDRKLRNLSTLIDPPLRVRESSGVAWHQSELVEYSPERSATVRVLDAHGQLCGFAKAYLDRDAVDAADQFNLVAASVALLDGIRTPRALGWARPDRIVVLEAMRGRRWSQLPAAGQSPAMTNLGAALAGIHWLHTDFGRGTFQRYDQRNVLAAADLVAQARPDLAEPVRRLGAKLSRASPSRGATVCLHGDVHINNVLFHSDEVHMIHLDKGGSGVASADVGSMLASLMTDRLLDPDLFGAGLGTSFLEGYGSIHPLPSTAELRWYTAAAFVAERAAGAITTVHVPTLTVLPEVLAMADGVLAGKVGLED